LVSRIDAFLQCLYVYFNHNPKKRLEFTTLAKIMETKGTIYYGTSKPNGYP
jgi:hypothetical protein